ncbi:MAG: Collagenase [Myxococcales bacterium]|nr:Collagenase [Myxococcales bacterium]
MQAVLLLLLTVSLSNEGYEQIGQKSDVVVYRRNGHAIDLAAEGDVAATPEVVMKVLTDYASHPKWVHGLSVSKVLGQSADSIDVYQRLHLPMLDDRDFAMHVIWKKDGDGRQIHFKTTNDRCPGPPDKGVTRVQLHEGSWILQSLDGGKRTHAIYRFRMELGGSLPMWMARGRAAKDVPALFDAIRKQTQFYR